VDIIYGDVDVKTILVLSILCYIFALGQIIY